MRISDTAPNRFQEWQKKLKANLKTMGVTQAHVYRGIGMSRNTWERRLNGLDFTVGEALKICEVINNPKK